MSTSGEVIFFLMKLQINYMEIDLKDYYKNAIKLISHDFPDAVFFVFSDEIEWTGQT